MNSPTRSSLWRRAAPGLLLMFAAPMCAEVLPGATRLSSLFVLPIEILVWGGGALLIREVVRRKQLGWSALLLLGLALAVAEECLIQQTSLAPLVIKLKGVEYARAFGVNYVYLLWALVYEAAFVVLVPIGLVELVFPRRAREPWVNMGSAIAVAALFGLGSFGAWFSWTQIARVKVFHLPPYTPPAIAVVAAIVAIVVLIACAVRNRPGLRAGAENLADTYDSIPSPRGARARIVPAIVGGSGATLWYALVLLAFGIAPAVPPAVAIAGGVAVCVLLLATLPGWVNSTAWRRRDTFALIFGTLLGSMLVSFVGFIGAAPADLWFKIAADVVATVLLLQLGRSVAKGGDNGVATAPD